MQPDNRDINRRRVDPFYWEPDADYVDATVMAADAPDNWFELPLTAINVREIPLTLEKFFLAYLNFCTLLKEDILAHPKRIVSRKRQGGREKGAGETNVGGACTHT